MAEQTQQPRQIAYKIPINQLLNNEFIQQEGWNPSYVQIKEKKISRINLIATVIDKQISQNLGTVTLDDSTGKIQARVFNEETKKLENINIGDPILLIGKPRKFNDSLFITIEIVKKIDHLWMKIRKQELEKEFDFKEKESTPVINSSGDKILQLIKSIDSGEGVSISELTSKSRINEKQIEEVLSELIKLGEIYEPKPGKVKVL